MRYSKLCLGVLMLLLIANCETKNEASELNGVSPKVEDIPPDDVYDYDNYPGDTNQTATDSNIGSGDHTTPFSDNENDNTQVWDSIADKTGLKATIIGSNENKQKVVLVCNAESVPAEVTFLPWVHMWGSMVIRDNLHGRIDDYINELIIDNVSLQDKGTYICFGKSSIKGAKETKILTESVNLNLTGVPSILFEKSLFSGKVGQPVNISIPFYSDSTIERFHILKNGTILPNTSDICTNLVNESTDYLIYGKKVKLEAHFLQFVIMNLSARHFDNYTLVLKNSIGSKEFTFHLVLFENKGRLSAEIGIMVAGVSALLIVGIVVIITVFLIKGSSQGKQSREESQPGQTVRGGR
ncbi:hypothetical protein CHS0354_016964 [Potamilus streckersoni]|uniref:Ig-like domain-containing protein n=1 Tax=Potamilus streckersoni TaxID=2493646 RepID=A0AAE0S7Z3_9BIVA|nr:hypothetical protein CHS0354_016964 [Potamilus streckersoni]